MISIPGASSSEGTRSANCRSRSSESAIRDTRSPIQFLHYKSTLPITSSNAWAHHPTRFKYPIVLKGALPIARRLCLQERHLHSRFDWLRDHLRWMGRTFQMQRLSREKTSVAFVNDETMAYGINTVAYVTPATSKAPYGTRSWNHAMFRRYFRLSNDGKRRKTKTTMAYLFQRFDEKPLFVGNIGFKRRLEELCQTDRVSRSNDLP